VCKSWRSSCCNWGWCQGGFWSISWYLLVKWCATLPSEGVEEDILFGFWSIYIEEVFAGFFPMRVSQDNLCVSIFSVIASLAVILFMQLMC
jgi:hypothetical protein